MDTQSPIIPSRMKHSYWANSKWNFGVEFPYRTSLVSLPTLLGEILAYPARARMIAFCYTPEISMVIRADENGKVNILNLMRWEDYYK